MIFKKLSIRVENDAWGGEFYMTSMRNPDTDALCDDLGDFERGTKSIEL